nr:MAG TPA: hypothetical protein [Caudoviricetes sp.]
MSVPHGHWQAKNVRILHTRASRIVHWTRTLIVRQYRDFS